MLLTLNALMGKGQEEGNSITTYVIIQWEGLKAEWEQWFSNRKDTYGRDPLEPPSSVGWGQGGMEQDGEAEKGAEKFLHLGIWTMKGKTNFMGEDEEPSLGACRTWHSGENILPEVISVGWTKFGATGVETRRDCWSQSGSYHQGIMLSLKPWKINYQSL